MAENAWLEGQVKEAREALAGCLVHAYPAEVLWTLVALLAFNCLVVMGRVVWQRHYPTDLYFWDV